MQQENQAVQRVIYIPYYLLLFSFMVIFLWQTTKERKTITQAEPGSEITEPVPAHDFTLPALTGGKISLSEFKGKIVFLNFWATWCPTCEVEMPSMERLYQIYKNENFIGDVDFRKIIFLSPSRGANIRVQYRCYLSMIRIAPPTMSNPPSIVFQVNASPSTIAARMSTNTTESLSMAATCDTLPDFNAKK